MTEIIDCGPNPFVTDIENATIKNNNYRTTLWTGVHLQVTLMSIDPGHDIGLEVHKTRDQFLRVEQGEATVVMGKSSDKMEKRWQVKDGDSIIVPAGTWHNLVSTGTVPLKIYSIYSPTEHPHGTVHVTKEDADKAEAEEE